jgi:hypothetical protein
MWFVLDFSDHFFFDLPLCFKVRVDSLVLFGVDAIPFQRPMLFILTDRIWHIRRQAWQPKLHLHSWMGGQCKAWCIMPPLSAPVRQPIRGDSTCRDRTSSADYPWAWNLLSLGWPEAHRSHGGDRTSHPGHMYPWSREFCRVRNATRFRHLHTKPTRFWAPSYWPSSVIGSPTLVDMHFRCTVLSHFVQFVSHMSQPNFSDPRLIFFLIYGNF